MSNFRYLFRYWDFEMLDDIGHLAYATNGYPALQTQPHFDYKFLVYSFTHSNISYPEVDKTISIALLSINQSLSGVN